MKKKLSGACAQINALVSPGLLLTLSILRLNRVPDPFRGMKSSENADMRRVLIVPPPGRMFAETFQLLAVSPAGFTNGAVNVTTVESKSKSPWKPT